MSLVLGPIHSWLFNKIRLQDELTKTLLSVFPHKQASLEEELDNSFGTLPEGELADLIDGGNIHGWLQERVSLVENRLAFAVGKLASDEDSRARLNRAAFSAGQAAKLSKCETAEEAYRALQDVVLDGMPCDRVNELRESSADEVYWERVRDLHSPYWEQNGADPKLFDEIRTSWVNGMLSDSDFIYRCEDKHFYIKKEA